MGRHPGNDVAQDFIAAPPVQQEMRRIWNNLPAFFTREIVEQPANAGQPHKLVARSHHREHRRDHARSLGDRRSCESCHTAEHFRPNPSHHQRVADQANCGGRRQFPSCQALKYNLGITRKETDRSANERDQPLADA